MEHHIPCFRMIGNLYFVGTYEASSHLLATEEGLILIDSGYASNVPVIVESVKKLGFDLKDLKYIVHSHGHYDHSDGTAELVAMTGAKTLLNFNDIKYIKGFTPDMDIRDGDVLRLGNTEIHFMFTPGHTEGTVSMFFNVTEDGKTYRAAMFGGAGTNQLKKDYMAKRGLSYHLRGQFFDSIERLKKEHVDVFIGNHSWQNHTEEKYHESRTSAQNPFIDDQLWPAFLEKCERNLWTVIETESRTHFVNYAHRGASQYAPENTFLSFYAGIFYGANGIETDVQRTKDGVLVLFHDNTLERVTGASGAISDYTFDELQELDVRNGELIDKIIRLEDFLKQFQRRDLIFAIELKQDGTTEEVIDLIKKYDLLKRTVITSFHYDYLKQAKAYEPTIHTGYLTKDLSDELMARMKADGIDEICPLAALVDRTLTDRWHRAGFNVRAWGVNDLGLMEDVYDACADGMTINFPDELEGYIRYLQKKDEFDARYSNTQYV